MKRTKALLGCVLCAAAVPAFAMEATGKLLISNDEGEIASRESSMVIPDQEGSGPILLKDGNQELTAFASQALKQNGRTVFYVVFLEANESLRIANAPVRGTATVFKGTYTAGSNQALYYGDFFTTGYDPARKADIMNQVRQLHANPGDAAGFTYQGGFFFKSAPSQVTSNKF